jgi:Tol biopolymer transport system component
MPGWSPDGRHIVGDPDIGVVIYTPQTKRARTILSDAVARAQWLADGRRIVFFDRTRIGSIDVDSGHQTIAAFPALPGVQLDYLSVASRDGSTLYVRQTLEQGDVWLVQFAKK